MTDYSAVVAQLPTLIVYGLGFVALMAIGVILVLLLDVLYLFALSIRFGERTRRHSTPKSAVLALLAAISGAAALPLAAQTTGQPVRTIEPRFTRVFGADSMDMGDPALSPDGRWVVFVRSEGAEAYNLWVVSTSGGEPIRLTSGRYSDDQPVWFPGGDRIAFRSDRTSSRDNPQGFVMTIPVDPRTGHATGPPRQVSLERTWRHVVSPDGSHIAYYTRRDSVQRLVVIPASGGVTRQLVAYGGSVAAVSSLRWSADGEWIYYLLRHTGSGASSVMRVGASRGDPQALGTVNILWPQMSRISPDGRHLLLRIDQGPGQEPLYEIATADGRPVTRLALHRNMRSQGFTPDGRGLLAVQSNMVAPIRVVPVEGGPVRQLTEAHAYDWPLGWNADGSRLFVQTGSNGRNTVLEVPVNGGTAVEWPIPAEARRPFALSRDGRFFLYGVGQDPASIALRIRRLSDGSTREITSAASYIMQTGASGPGGGFNPADSAEFFYFERRDNRLQLWAAPAEGASRLLRTFPLSYAGRTSFGVHGSRIAYTERRGDSTALFVAEGRDGQPRHLATVAGSAGMPAWSNNGRWIAYDHYAAGDNSRYNVLVVGVGANGAMTVPPRILESGAMWGWQVEWLPNDQAFTVFGMTGAGSETHVFLVSLREGERPVTLTRDDPSVRWGYELSPDGRYVAYPAEIPRGSSIWRVDLGDVLAPASGGGGSRRR